MTTKEALAVVFSCADEYKENLVDHSLLFLCQDKHKNTYCVEVTFDISNFQHLTGFKTVRMDSESSEHDSSDENVAQKTGKKKITAAHFFELCIDRRLSENDFEFAEDGTTPLKMKVLPSVVKKSLSANMIGFYNGLQPRLYTERIAGSVKACVGFVRDEDDGRYVPNTVLEGDIRQKVTRPDRILVTYRKKSDTAEYSEIVYAAKKVDWKTIKVPKEYPYLQLPVESTAEIVEKPVSTTDQEDERNQENETRFEPEMRIVEAVATYRDLEWDDERIALKLQDRYAISREEAERYLIS